MPSPVRLRAGDGGHPQLVGIRNWRASTTVKKQRSPRNGARLGRARGIDTWNSGLIVGKPRGGGAPLSVLLFEEDVHKRASTSSMQQVSYLTTRGWKEGHANAATPEYQCTQRATLRSAPMSTRTPVVCTSPEALRGCACGVRCGLCGPSRGRHSCYKISDTPL